MMTSKEALEKIGSMTYYEWNKNPLSKYFKKEFDEIEKSLNELKELKRYPTADEVCEALSKWVKKNIPDIWNYKVYYDMEGFHYYNNCDFEEYLVEFERIDKAISLSVFLPPHVVIMIGRFYEGLERAGKEE